MNRFNGLLNPQILSLDALSKTVKTVAEMRFGHADPQAEAWGE
jgi:hypothetical protein